MTYQPKKMLPDDLRDYQARSWWYLNRDKVVGGVCAILFLLYWLGERIPANAAPIKKPSYTMTAQQCGAIVSACANDGGFVLGDLNVQCEGNVLKVQE